MIMPSSKVEFEKLAEEAVNEFFKESQPLKKCVVRVATNESLNPNEVQRLVELANIKATLKMLAASTDKTVEFDLAKYDEVLSELMNSPEYSQKEKSVTVEKDESPTEVLDSDRIPSFVDKNRMDNRPSLFDMFGVKKPGEDAKDDEPPKHVVIMKLKKQAEQYTQEKIANELKVYDTYDYLVSEFSKLRSPDFNKFANEAISLHGSKIEPVINSLSKDIKKSYTLEKTAEDINDNSYNKVIDDSTKLIKSIDTMVGGLTKIAEADKNIDYCKTALEETKKGLSEG